MLALLILLPLALLEVISPLADVGPLQVRVTAADHRLAELAATAPAVTDPVDPLPCPAHGLDSSHRARTGHCRLRCTAPAFHHLDLDLPPGTRVAVVEAVRFRQVHPGSGADAVPRPCSRGGAHRRQTHDPDDAR